LNCPSCHSIMVYPVCDYCGHDATTNRRDFIGDKNMNEWRELGVIDGKENFHARSGKKGGVMAPRTCPHCGAKNSLLIKKQVVGGSYLTRIKKIRFCKCGYTVEERG
jgi:DNA-directed RNA polymerase subunit M/transcription elongation factor TFIIS